MEYTGRFLARFYTNVCLFVAIHRRGTGIALILMATFSSLAFGQLHDGLSEGQAEEMENEGEPDGPEVSTAHSTMEEKEFNKIMQSSDFFTGITELFKRMNQAEKGVKEVQALRFSIEKVKGLPKSGKLQLTEIIPEITESGEMILKLLVPSKFTNNPVILLEGLSRLNSMVAAENLNLTVQGDKKTEGIQIFLDQHGHYVTKDKAYTSKWEHWHSWGFSHRAITMLGIRRGRTVNGSRPFTALELRMNAEGGSRLAQRELLEIEVNNARASMDSLQSFYPLKYLVSQEQLKNFILEAAAARGFNLDPKQRPLKLWFSYYQNYIDQLEKELKEKTVLAKKELASYRARKNDPGLKAKKDELEKLDVKLEALVKKNDRKGVADLLTVYLNLDTLEPVEREFWSQQIEAIRHPDLRKSVVLFRGLDKKTDRPQVSLDARGKEVGRGYFSSLLIYNQGSYTRRLRSLDTMRERLGNELTQGNKIDSVSPLISTPKISRMMNLHSYIAQGSPFLSFSMDPQVAAGFGEAGVIAVRVDPRRIVPNLVSVISSEDEVLIPLIIFPDEVLHLSEIENFSQSPREVQDKFLKEVNKKLGRPENTNFWDSEAQKSFGYSKRTYEMFRSIQFRIFNSRACRQIFAK